MPDLRLAFWNVQNLFEPGVVDRGPQSDAERNLKIAHLTQLINGFFDNEGPDVIALAELGAEAILLAIRDSLNGSHVHLWQSSEQPTQTGIGVIA